MLVFAHFTVRELPGTLAILIAGVLLGIWYAAAGRRRLDLLTVLLAGLAVVGLVVAVLSDHSRGVNRLLAMTTGDLGWQVLWLLVTCLLLARLSRAGRPALRSDGREGTSDASPVPDPRSP